VAGDRYRQSRVGYGATFVAPAFKKTLPRVRMAM